MSASSSLLALLFAGFGALETRHLWQTAAIRWASGIFPEPVAEESAPEPQPGPLCPRCECECEPQPCEALAEVAQPELPPHRALLQRLAAYPGYAPEAATIAAGASWALSRVGRWAARARLRRRPRVDYAPKRVPADRARPAVSL